MRTARSLQSPTENTLAKRLGEKKKGMRDSQRKNPPESNLNTRTGEIRAAANPTKEVIGGPSAIITHPE